MLGRYLLSLRRFWGTAAAGQLEYQLNLLIELLAMAGNLAGSLFLLSLIFHQGEGVGAGAGRRCRSFSGPTPCSTVSPAPCCVPTSAAS